ncbi:MAG: ABC transporter substrate-binding protein [Desulfatiglans sp.]|nr:ABC transporter substrate-binding protein [Desulfatiglans sp.]
MTSFNDAIPGYVFSGLFFTEKYLKKSPEKVRAFLKGLIKAFEYIQANEEKARKWLPKYTGVELEVAMKSALREYSNGREPEESLYRQQAIMMKIGYLPEKVPVEKITDYSFLPE